MKERKEEPEEPKLSGYALSRAWFNFSFENPDKVRPIHAAVYLWSVELCNRLGWKVKFGLPTGEAMEVLGITNKNSYLKALNDLIEWGFITEILASKNQNRARIVSIYKTGSADTKNDTALDTTLIQQVTRHGYDNCNDTDTIDKRRNPETLKPSNIKTGRGAEKPTEEEILLEAQMRDMRPVEETAENYSNMRGRDNFMRTGQNGNMVPIYDWRKDMALLYSKGALKSKKGNNRNEWNGEINAKQISDDVDHIFESRKAARELIRNAES